MWIVLRNCNVVLLTGEVRRCYTMAFIGMIIGRYAIPKFVKIQLVFEKQVDSFVFIESIARTFQYRDSIHPSFELRAYYL